MTGFLPSMGSTELETRNGSTEFEKEIGRIARRRAQISMLG
jgi:hypothetical protein